MNTRSIDTAVPVASAALGAAAAPADPEYLAWAAARQKRIWRRRILPALGIAGLIVLWWVVIVAFGVKPFIAPTPGAVLETLYAKRGVLLDNLLPTAFEAAGGFVLGNLAAIVVATIFVHNKTLQDIFFPVVLMFNAVPLVAKAPVLVLIMGNGVEPKITIAALVCFFPTLVNMVRGLESVNPQAMELMRVLSASKTEIFFRLRLLNALPYLFSALRIAASMCVIGAVVGEWVGATVGIGAMILQATFNFDSPLLYAAIVMSATLSGLFFLLVTLAEKWVIRWQPESTH
ncbi:ABC transporter, permease protein [Variovorax paradoxus B4]|uniref:ABC transporter, permease protein n=2 Tax=Variovorax paradoxus TaxID=34073 RepID=T1XET0_VARPD|nr:ABC transporter permease [Variovorax paradoxus]AGU50600.1 ABC transporter, permease protein [Variovorax paradoxus B4]KLN55706.1 putative aliphatic sulfonates transport permease protein SsuC [Variovorax paradoxus]